MRRWFQGWRGVLTTAVLGALLVGGGLVAAVVAARDTGGVDERLLDEPGGVPLPGQLECSLPQAAARTPVPGPDGVTATTALVGGEVVAAAADGLWRGTPAEGGLERWADQPEVGEVQALARGATGTHLFAAGPRGVAAVDLEDGQVVSSRPLPTGTTVTGVTATNRRVFVLTSEGTVLESGWAYDELGQPAPVRTDEPLPPVTQVLASPDGSVLLLAQRVGPLLRLSLESGRTQPLPVADDVRAETFALAPDGLVHVGYGPTLRVLDLNERWVTGRLSDPVRGWDGAVAGLAAVPAGLVVTDEQAALGVLPYPECNREELTRLRPPTG